jgi:hypothetical protein
MQSASPDELLADVASQEAAARSNIERLGFRPQEAAQIVTSIRIDPTLDFASLNANFPAIEADIKKRFNVKLLTPTFFSSISSPNWSNVGVAASRFFLERSILSTSFLPKSGFGRNLSAPGLFALKLPLKNQDFSK